MKDYKIVRTTPEDLNFVFWLYEEAMKYQYAKGYNVWKGYDKEVLASEMNAGLQHKLILDEKIAMVFSAIYSDKLLWQDLDHDDAVYVHRLVVNPESRGQGLFKHVFEWLIADAQSKGRKYLRLDTWGDNPKMIAYYESFGYKFIKNHSSGDDQDLPSPHRNMYFALMEYEI